VLVAEDDPEMRRVLVRLFRREGLVVSEAQDGLELEEIATEMLRDEGAAPELVVTDVRMPGRSGIEALRALRATLQHSAILVITAFGDEATHREAAAVGAARVLDKPFERDALIEAVVKLMR
jgi:CheY-like chemotaxis protein